MRTTVTLEPDVAATVKQLMRDEDIGFKEAVNRLIRAASRPARPDPFRTKTSNMGQASVDLDKANALAGALEDEEILAKLAAGR